MRLLLCLWIAQLFLCRDGIALAEPPWIAEKQLVNAPVGYYELCLRWREACEVSRDGEMVATVSKSHFMMLKKFNQKMNQTVVYRSDQSQFGVKDYWVVARDAGDCEDVALAKRMALIAAGWPANALWLAIGMVPGGQSHVVLVLRSNRGDLILDNRVDRISLWHQADLRLLARQVPGELSKWRRFATPL